MRRTPARRPSPPPTSTPGRTRWWGWRRATALAASTAFGLAAIGCGSDGADTPSATLPTVTTTKADATSEPEPTSTTAAPTVEEQVEAAYLAAQAAYFSAAEAADPEHADLEATTTGPSLDRARELVSGFREAGIEVRYIDDTPPMPKIISTDVIDGSHASLEVCIVDNGQQVLVADGTVVDDTVESRLNIAEVHKVDGRWVLYTQRGIARWADGDGCDR